MLDDYEKIYKHFFLVNIHLNTGGIVVFSFNIH